MTANPACKFLPGQLVQLGAEYRTKRFSVVAPGRSVPLHNEPELLEAGRKFRFVQLAGVLYDPVSKIRAAPTALIRDEGGTWRVPLRLIEAAANQPVPKQLQPQQQPQEAGHGAEGDRIG